MADKTFRRGLGRGLSALMADLGTAPSDGAPPPPPPAPDRMLPVEAIRPNPGQPRRRFDEAALDELAASIRRRGVIQPLIVRPAGNGVWEIVAGERRWRAAQRAGLSQVPVLVRDYSDAEMAEVAVIENVQRADLDPIDEGAAYRALIDRFGHTQEQVAEALGKSRSHIANQMRLLQLPAEVQAMVQEGRLTAGHVRPLIGHPRAAELAKRIADRRLSAREAEKLAKAPPLSRRAAAERAERDPDTRAVEADLSASLGMAVTIRHGRDGSGRLSIAYRDLEQLDELLARLSGR